MNESRTPDTAASAGSDDSYTGADGVDRNDGAAPTAEDVVARILSRAGTALASTASGHVQREADDDGLLEREARAGTRRIASLTTELEDVSEVEYRQIRL